MLICYTYLGFIDVRPDKVAGSPDPI
jgi:hypothetical protein